MMNILGCLDRPTAGTYRARRHAPSSALDDDGLARVRSRTIGFVFQSYNLLPRTSALDNVATPLLYQGVGRRGATAARDGGARAARPRRPLAHEPTELSGGQQQRVAVARAIVTEPGAHPRRRADRQPRQATPAPTSWRVLRELHAAGSTIVLITHDADVADAGGPPGPRPRRAGRGMSVLELVRLALSRLRTSRLRAGPHDARRDHRRRVGGRARRRRPGDDVQHHGAASAASARTSLTISPTGRRRTGRPRSDARRRGRDRRRSTASRRSRPRCRPRLTVDRRRPPRRRRRSSARRPTTPSVRAFEVWQGTFLTPARRGPGAAGRRARRHDGRRPRHRPRTTSGTEIRIGGLPFQVIGILQPKGGSGFQDPDDQVIVPVGTVQKYFVGGDSVADDRRQHQRTPRRWTPSRPTSRRCSADRHELGGDRRRRLQRVRPDPAARGGHLDQRHADAAARRDRLDLAASSAASGS